MTRPSLTVRAWTSRRNSKTAKQQAVLDLFHELALGAPGTQQLLGCNARTNVFNIRLVHAGKQAVHLDQRNVVHGADLAQRMIGRNEIFQFAQGSQTRGEVIGGACMSLKSEKKLFNNVSIRQCVEFGKHNFSSPLTLSPERQSAMERHWRRPSRCLQPRRNRALITFQPSDV